MSELIVVPDEDALCVAIADAGTLREVRRFSSRRERWSPIESVRGRHEVAVHDGRWVTAISERGDACDLLAWDGAALGRPRTFAVDGVVMHAVAVRGDWLYAGGTRRTRDDGDKLFVGRLHDGAIAMQPIALPPALLRSGKGIDAIVLDGTRLIAVDNVREPKWILVYDVTDPRAPRHVATHDFLHQANGEIIVRAVLGPCLAILAVHISDTRITFHDRTTFAELASIAPAWRDPDSVWATMAFADDRLYVPAGARGVGSVDVPRSSAPRGANMPPFLARTSATLTYRPAPSGQPVLFVTPARGGLFLHTQGRGGAQSEWMPIS